MKNSGAPKLDRNKTPLTHRVTATAMAFLDGLFCRPIETEVAVASGWIADIGALLQPCLTSLRELKLDQRFRDGQGDDVYDSFRHFNERCGRNISVIIEVKTSKSDFQRDVKDKFLRPPPAHICLLAYPMGMIKEEEVPHGWGALRTTKEGQRVYRRPIAPRIHPQHPGDLISFFAELAKRTEVRSRPSAFRNMVRMWNANDTEKRKNARVDTVLRLMFRWVKGDLKNWEAKASFKDLLKMYGVHLKGSMVDNVEEFEKIFPKKQIKSKRSKPKRSKSN